MKKRYTEEQITYALRQREGGKPVTEICREMGVSDASFDRNTQVGQTAGTHRAFRSEKGRTAIPNSSVGLK